METPEKTNEQTKKKCFVIMPISDVDGYPKDISTEFMII